MTFLVLNCGSSSIKYAVFEADGRTQRLEGLVEHLGETGGPDLRTALETVLARLPFRDAITAVGHRVVHGGESFVAPTRIDDAVLEALRPLDNLAPLHNPVARQALLQCRALLPDCPQFAFFDTAFHRSMPARASTYAVPRSWRAEGQHRYGFHGLSHAHVCGEAARLLGRPLHDLNLISLHLGNGASAAAVERGRCVDTSMGFTPLEGLVMGTRGGDLDPGLLLQRLRDGSSLSQLEQELTRESGLRGLCGDSDLRTIRGRAAAGDAEARLALEVFTYRIRKYIGAYLAVLGRADALVFTGGIGEHDAQTRAEVLSGLEGLGFQLDGPRNAACRGGPAAIQRDGAPIALFVIPSDEAREIARALRDTLDRS